MQRKAAMAASKAAAWRKWQHHLLAKAKENNIGIARSRIGRRGVGASQKCGGGEAAWAMALIRARRKLGGSRSFTLRTA